MSRFLKWVVNIILIAAILVACALLIPPFTGVTTIIVDDVDMVTNLDRGSVTYGIPKDVSELAVGNEIIVENADGSFVYRLNSIDPASKTGELEDVRSTDGQKQNVTFNQRATKVILTVPFIGYVVMAMKSTEGLIIIGLGVIFVIILFILSELWKKDREDEEDEEDEENVEADATPVDMSAHILEKVSSEIGSEISNVIAQDSTQVGGGATEDVSDAVSEDTREITQELKEEATTKEMPVIDEMQASEDVVADEESEDANEETSETSNDSIGEETTVEATEAAKVDDKAIEASDEEMPVMDEAEELADDEEPVEVAMPTHTAEELLEKAKAAGHEPEVKKDDSTGITILDYSDIL